MPDRGQGAGRGGVGRAPTAEMLAGVSSEPPSTGCWSASPGTDGLSVLRAWSAQRLGVPVIVLSARGETADKVHGLDTGADDYVTKPSAFDKPCD